MCADALFSNSPSVFGLVIMKTAVALVEMGPQIFEIHQSVSRALDRDCFESGDGRTRRIRVP